MKFKVGDFATIDRQIVQIKRIRTYNQHGKECYQIQIKLTNDRLLHWVDLEQLQPLKCQKAPKVLFG